MQNNKTVFVNEKEALVDHLHPVVPEYFVQKKFRSRWELRKEILSRFRCNEQIIFLMHAIFPSHLTPLLPFSGPLILTRLVTLIPGFATRRTQRSNENKLFWHEPDKSFGFGNAEPIKLPIADADARKIKCTTVYRPRPLTDPEFIPPCILSSPDIA